MENLINRAVTSAFYYQISKGLEEPKLPIKSIERRMRQLSSASIAENPSFDSLVTQLRQGVPISMNGLRFVAQTINLEEIPSGGQLKRLAREIDRRTHNPKTSRGTVWRRNSAVKERRRQVKDWSTGSAARTEAKRASEVTLFSYEIWLIQKEMERKLERGAINDKRDKRYRRRLLDEELQRRIKEDVPREELMAATFLKICDELAEKDGITDRNGILKSVVESIKKEIRQPIIFVWGPPYEGQVFDTDLFGQNKPEKTMADAIEIVFKRLQESEILLQPILLYADTYGEINNIYPDEIELYGQKLADRFKNTAFFLPWSRVKVENLDIYKQIAASISSQNIEITRKNTITAKKIQEKLGRSISLSEATRLAYLYKRERLIEGQILTDGFIINEQYILNIIKLGTAPSRMQNDEPYEPKLPRIYIKDMPRAAWNKSR